MRRFPVMWPWRRGQVAEMERLACPRSVPWSVAEPAREQARRNHSQSLEELARRGGLDPVELAGALTGKAWSELRAMELATAVGIIKAASESGGTNGD